MSQLWEIQEGEPKRAFNAFVLYRDMEPAERAYRKVAEALDKDMRQIERWGTENNWQERVRAFDNWIANRAAEKRAQAVERVYEKVAEHADDIAQRLVEFATGAKDPTSPQVRAIADALDRLGAVARKELNLSGSLGLEHLLTELAAEDDGEEDE